MKYFARRIKQVILSSRSFVSLLELARVPNGEPVRLFFYYFFCEPQKGTVTKVLIYMPNEKEEALNSPPFGTGKTRLQNEWLKIPGRLSWLHNVACAPTIQPHWFPVDSPLPFR